MNLKQKTDNILNMYGLKAKKRFGQNFLVDDEALEDIVAGGDITKEDLVIEIGPGLGALTEFAVKQAGLVMAFEIDNNMVKILNETFKDNNNIIIASYLNLLL